MLSHRSRSKHSHRYNFFSRDKIETLKRIRLIKNEKEVTKKKPLEEEEEKKNRNSKTLEEEEKP